MKKIYWFCCQVGQKERSQSKFWQIKDSPLVIKDILTNIYIFLFACRWNGLYSRPVFSLCFNFSFSFLYAEWVTLRRFHSRVNQAETPIHQTGMWVLFLLIGGIQRWGDRTTSWWVVLAEFGLLSKLSCHPRPPPYLQSRGLGRRGGGGGAESLQD